ncbi:hypothetical protein KCV87_30685 [Actinosynnema pretiosum subsp. pretiosum]|uniref:Uncharacterized protein n=2 Tax=Actinosynnema TaxID=40566 RepID=C6WQT2_ACTMD|nr:G1 family glutamic endopeptidase [Actinosynnema mirum]ACU38772.1 hypothetical protein Amir_4946 [Actinosynnema mirum DSM 43827]AXX32369.1 hypothetical protein APASM_5004 [Actinosynnema pretiosum subsp. pretiosum]QUF03693.1 hypothetical protein KCV87_30685 [Actinosynnema pretiosum subsp. pretiosum]
MPTPFEAAERRTGAAEPLEHPPLQVGPEGWAQDPAVPPGGPRVAPEAPPRVEAPPPPLAEAALPGTDAGSSTNWAGYVLRGAPGTFRSVSATWTVPHPHSRPGVGDYYTQCAVWVGLDGAHPGAGHLAQVGVDVNDLGGEREYQLWWELETGGVGASPIPHPVRAGDELRAGVAHLFGGTFAISVECRAAGWAYRRRHSYPPGTPVPPLGSAEVIVEAPMFRGVTGMLTDFGSVEFLDVAVNDLPLSGFAGAATRYDMVDGVELLAETGPLGDGFGVCWRGYGRPRRALSGQVWKG